ncbi:hypothetical protein FS819_028655 (plasmid) [Allorhizobium sp. Av2]|nr:hypothetical protein [Allorhizobium sp. Av2]
MKKLAVISSAILGVFTNVPAWGQTSGPTEAEALAAYQEAYSRNPMSERGSEKEITIALGECGKNATGPGVSCMLAIKYNPGARPIDRVIGFSKSATGEWVALSF